MRITINGINIEATPGSTILAAARAAGIYIPTLCDYPNLTPTGSCRICLVEVQGKHELQTACDTLITDGMQVRTETKEVQESRKTVLEVILADHPSICLVCDRTEPCGRFDVCVREKPVTERCLACPKNQRCELQRVVQYVAIKKISIPIKDKKLPIDAEQPFFDRDPNLCILCGRCLRTCREVRGIEALCLTSTQDKPVVGPTGTTLRDSGCQFCGACVDACPTGSLTERSNKWAGLAEKVVTTICPYCGAGCQLNLEVKDRKIIRVAPDKNGPVNQGQACVKGRFSLGYVNDRRRLTKPLIRRWGELTEVTWEEALDFLAENFSKHKGSFAAIASAKCTNEDGYVLQKFARAVMGTNNIDNSARMCHAPTLAGLGYTLGTGAMTNAIQDIDGAACIFLTGTNISDTQPITAIHVRKALRNGAKLIVANPLKTDLCESAAIWLQHRPGTDVALLSGLMAAIIDNGWLDNDFIAQRCEDFDLLKESLKGFDMGKAEEITGVSRDKLLEAARLYATSKPGCIIYGMGITQHVNGTDNVLAIANLAMATGNLGKPSSGIYPLRGHNNVQGTCDMGCLPDYLPGYKSIGDGPARQRFEKAWNCILPLEEGLSLTEMFAASLSGDLKALNIAGMNPVLSLSDSSKVKEALRQTGFLVVQDLFLTETADLAHVVLPTTSFAEEEGTFTNTERRIQRVRQALDPVGECRPEWWITSQIAKRLGHEGFNYNSASEIMG